MCLFASSFRRLGSSVSTFLSGFPSLSRRLPLCFVRRRGGFNSIAFVRCASCRRSFEPEITSRRHLHLATSASSCPGFLSSGLGWAGTEPTSHTPFLFRLGADQVQRHKSTSARGIRSTSSPLPAARAACRKLSKVTNPLPARYYPLLLLTRPRQGQRQFSPLGPLVQRRLCNYRYNSTKRPHKYCILALGASLWCTHRRLRPHPHTPSTCHRL